MKKAIALFSFIALILFGLFLIYFYIIQDTKKDDTTEIIFPSGNEILATLAITSVEKRIGLSNLENLASDEGMLFIYDTEGFYSFWMKDMNFEIDMIWLNKKFEIVHIENNVRPESYPESFISDVPAQYILEINGGQVGERGLKINDRLLLHSQ